MFYPTTISSSPALKEYANRECPIAEDCASKVLSLPVHPLVSEDDVKEIIQTLKSIGKKENFNLIEYTCILIIGIGLIYLTIFTLIEPIYNWDAVVVWDAKARFIFHMGDVDSYMFYHTVHPHYPLMVPLNMTFFYSIFLEPHYLCKVIFLSYYLCIILFIYFSLRRFKLNRTYCFLITAMYALTFDLFYQGHTAFADTSVGLFYLISSVLLYQYFTTRERKYLLFSSIFLGLLMWTKQEGFAISIVNLGVLFLFELNSLRKRDSTFKEGSINLVIFFIIAALLYLPWFLTLGFYDIDNPYYLNALFGLDIETVLNDLVIILGFLYSTFFNLFLLWVTFLFIIILNGKNIKYDQVPFLFMLGLFHMLMIIFIYIATPFDLVWHMATSIDRELLHLTPVIVFFMGILISYNEDNDTLDFTQSKYYHITKIFLIFIFIFMIVDTIFYALLDFAITNLFYAILDGLYRILGYSL